MLVEKEAMLVEVFQRQTTDWRYQALSQPEDRLVLPSLEFSFPLAELYESLPPVEAA